MHCTTFAGDWVLRVTGQDPIAEYRAKYSTEAEARALLAELDGTLLDALKKRFGEPVHPSKAQRGDIAYFNDACGICFVHGARMEALFLGERGFSVHRMRDIDWVFRVTDRVKGWPRLLNEYVLEAQNAYLSEGFSWAAASEAPHE